MKAVSSQLVRFLPVEDIDVAHLHQEVLPRVDALVDHLVPHPHDRTADLLLIHRLVKLGSFEYGPSDVGAGAPLLKLGRGKRSQV